MVRVRKNKGKQQNDCLRLSRQPPYLSASWEPLGLTGSTLGSCGYPRSGPLRQRLEHFWGSFLAEGCGSLEAWEHASVCRNCVKTRVLRGLCGEQSRVGVCVVCSTHAFLVHLECEIFDPHAQWNACETISWFEIKPQTVVLRNA